MTQAFVFPGQGSQSIGMLSDAADKSSVIKDVFAQASSVLKYDLWDLVQQGSADVLSQTNKTQPALLTASVALWRAWCESGGERPSVFSGHSLGEYSALVCADVLGFEDAVALVEKRGCYMQEAVPAGTGKMAAILGLDNSILNELCEGVSLEVGELVSAANFNAPGQVVIAGSVAAVDAAIVACKEAGAKRALPLAVSVPSHCELMKPASDKLAADLSTLALSVPSISVINNVDAKIETAAENISAALVRQLYSPVRWVDVVESMKSMGVDRILECGPGNVLSGLNKRIDKNLTLGSIEKPDAFDAALNNKGA